MVQRDAARPSAFRPATDGDLGPSARGGIFDPHTWQIVLRRHGALVLCVFALTLTVAGVVVAMRPPQFSATASVFDVAPTTRTGSQQAVEVGEFDGMLSPAIAKRVVDGLKLWERREFNRLSPFQRLASDVLALFGRKSDGDSSLRERALSRFRDAVTMRRRDQSPLVDIGFNSEAPDLAAHVANAIAESFVDNRRAGNGDARLRALAALRERVEELRTRLRASEQAVDAYVSEHKIISVAARALMERQIAALETQLGYVRERSATMRARLGRIEKAVTGTGDAAALDALPRWSSIVRLRSQRAALMRSEAELSRDYGKRYPALVSARAEIVSLGQLIENEIAEAVTAARDDVEVVTATEASLAQEIVALRNQLAQGNQADDRLRGLQREAEADRVRFEQAVSEARATVEAQNLRSPDAQILTRALAPGRPQPRSLVPLFLVAGIGGLALGIGLAFAAEGLERGYRTCAEIEDDLPVACLGIVPVLSRSGWRGVAKALRPASPGDLSRFAVEQTAAPEAESLHAVLAAIGPARRRRPAEVLLFTSARSGEGCSTVAANLAHLAATSGLRTLLISADFTRVALADRHGAAIAGLVRALRSGRAIGAIARDPASGLHMLAPAGRTAFRDAVVERDAGRIAGMLEDARKNFDVVMVDGPPIPMPAQNALIDHADRVLLVVAWRSTPRERVIAALQAIGTRIDKLSGVILNKVDLGEHRLYAARTKRSEGRAGAHAPPQPETQT